MEPQWNPTVEEQALARVHRMGQKKEVTTIRFVMEGTFEEVSFSPSPYGVSSLTGTEGRGNTREETGTRRTTSLFGTAHGKRA